MNMVLNPTLKTLEIEKIEERESISKFFTYLIWNLRFNFQLIPSSVTLIILLNIFLKLSPLIDGYLLGIVINGLLSKNIDSIISAVFFYLTFKLLLSLFSVAVNTVDGYSERIALFKYKTVFAQIISQLKIEQLEDSEIANKVYRVSQSYMSLWKFTSKLIDFLTSVVSAAISFVVVSQINIIGAVIAFIIVLIRSKVYGKELKEDWRFLFKHTENLRIADGYIGSISDVASLKEILFMNKVSYFINKYQKFADWFTNVFVNMRIKRFYINIFFDFLLVSIFGYVFYNLVLSFLSGNIELGGVTFAISAFATYFGTVKNSLGMFIAVSEAKERVIDAYDVYHIQKDTIKKKGKVKDIDIQLNNISFKYSNSKNLILKDINLHIKKGEKVAIVGENGAGKTTLINLILGHYTPTKGKILIGNIDMSKVDISTWYKKIGVMSQNSSGYDFLSLKENITLGNFNSTLYSKIKKLVGIDDMVKDYKFKDDQIVGAKYKNGINPSGGQWQKINIARTLYQDKPIIILDEPTSALDSISEFKIFNKFFDSFKSKTVIIIAHRFSTVKKADRIIVLSKGRIVEEGGHKELLELDGVYAKAYKIQADGFKD